MSRLILSHTGVNLLPTQVRVQGTYHHKLVRPNAMGRHAPILADLVTEHAGRNLHIKVCIEGTTNSLSIPKTGLADLVRKTQAFIEAAANGTLDTAEVAA